MSDFNINMENLDDVIEIEIPELISQAEERIEEAERLKAGLSFENAGTPNACMLPYDVGDGVVTIGPGLTKGTTEGLYADINDSLGTSYTEGNGCVSLVDMMDYFEIRIQTYWVPVNDLELLIGRELNENQRMALLILGYNSPGALEDPGITEAVSNPNTTEEELIEAIDNYYKGLAGYDTFGDGWHNRTLDTVELYFYGDGERNH